MERRNWNKGHPEVRTFVGNGSTVFSMLPPLRYQVNAVAFVPSVIYQILNYPGLKADDLKSIQTLSSGAAYLPPAFAEKLSSLISNNAVFLAGNQTQNLL